MKFYSTNKKSPFGSLKEVVMRGMPLDKGLYMPERIPKLDKQFFQELTKDSWKPLCLKVAEAFIGEDVSKEVIREIIDDAFYFDAPLVELEKGLYILELFHGPTLSFKDFGSRFMARLISFFLKEKSEKKLCVLVATSGDTGSAVGNGFLGVQGIDVVILYPKGKVSRIQEQQMATMGRNVEALEIEGTFDDCQKLVKEAFADLSLQEKISLTSANSINFARLLPQMFYYIYAYAQLKERSKPFVFSVPSGNFGNLVAGLFAGQMGLPVHHYIASTNRNNSVPEYLKSGVFRPRASVRTISNSMDVGNPSNFGRMLDLYGNSRDKMSEKIYGASFNDDETREAIVHVKNKYAYLMDPHGAVGYLGLCQYLKTQAEPINGIVLETAHPAKFLEEVQAVVKEEVKIPENLQRDLELEKKTTVIPNHYEALKNFLLSF